jgi:catechol 2,3-dioxygenase-like lactoylglutathione lyase family enzyme
MNLNHVNLCTDNVAECARFFEKLFGFRLEAMRGLESFAVLTGSDGFVLNLMKPGKAAPASYPDGFHVGFFVATPDEVYAKQTDIIAFGLPKPEVKLLNRAGHATVTLYCHAPGGILVEVASSA